MKVGLRYVTSVIEPITGKKNSKQTNNACLPACKKFPEKIDIEINSQNSEKVCESSWQIQFRWQPLLFLEYDISKQTLELLEID